jgi:large subunit ribosomal protein L19e
MNLKTQKRIAAKVLKCSPKRVVLDQASSQDIKEAITRADIKNLVSSNLIVKLQKKNNSRSRIRKNMIQKRKGRRSGPGSRKGKHGARVSSKGLWMIKVRLQRSFIKELKDKTLIEATTYRNLYSKVKGGYFRNKRHIKLYLEEQSLFQTK